MCNYRCRRRRTSNRDYHGGGEEENDKIFPRYERRGFPHTCETKECSGGAFKCHTHPMGNKVEANEGLVGKYSDIGTDRNKIVIGYG
jgi:hypothetical protein